MEKAFWQSRWREGKIAFHEGMPNQHLKTHFSVLSLALGSHVFVPLSGKSLDLDWLLTQSIRVSGIELNQDAVTEVFDRLQLVPDVSQSRDLLRFSGGNLVIWVGDFFALKPEDIVPVDAVYDRAALVALPSAMRKAYVDHLQVLCPKVPQLLISLDYDQSQTDGPPFSVPEDRIRDLYDDLYDVRRLAGVDISGPLASRCSGLEEVWHLRQAG